MERYFFFEDLLNYLKLLSVVSINHWMGPKKAAGKKAPPGGENGGELDPEQKITFLMHTCQSLQVQLGRLRLRSILI